MKSIDKPDLIINLSNGQRVNIKRRSTSSEGKPLFFIRIPGILQREGISTIKQISLMVDEAKKRRVNIFISNKCCINPEHITMIREG